MVAAQIALLETGPLVESSALPGLIGWTLKPEGLCRDEQCVIVPDRAALEKWAAQGCSSQKSLGPLSDARF